MPNQPPLNLILQTAKSELNSAVFNIQHRYKISSAMMEGIVAENLVTLKQLAMEELLNDMNQKQVNSINKEETPNE